MANARKTYVKSPDGRVSVEFSLDRKGCPCYSVSYGDKDIILPSCMGFVLSDGSSLSDGFRIKKILLSAKL